MFNSNSINSQSVTFNLVVINVLAFLATVMLGGNAETQGYFVNSKFGLYLPTSDYFMPWQIVTHFFLHGNFMHLFFNMYALFMFGSALERVWGPKKFLIYYVITALGAAFTYTVVRYWEIGQLPEIYRLAYEGVPVVGASGAVFGLLLGFGMLFPNTELFLMFVPIPIKAKYFVIGYGAIEPFSGFARVPGDNVAHFAHLGGMIFGFIMIQMWKQNRNDFY